MIRVLTPTVEELEAERDEILQQWPRLAGIREDCYGCASQEAATVYGWGDATDAYERLTQVCFLLQQDMP